MAIEEVSWLVPGQASAPLPAWVISRGGAEFVNSEIKVLLRGQRSRQVTILDIVPVLKDGHCLPPMTGTAIPNYPGGSSDTIWLSSELDSAAPEFEMDDPNDDEPPVPFADGPTFHVAEDEELALDFRVRATGLLCEWRAKLVYTTDGRQGEMELGPPGGGWWAVSGQGDPQDYDRVIATNRFCANAPVTLDPVPFFDALSMEGSVWFDDLCPQ